MSGRNDQVEESCKHHSIMVDIYEQGTVISNFRPETNTFEYNWGSKSSWWVASTGGECVDCGKELSPDEIKELTGLKVFRFEYEEV